MEITRVQRVCARPDNRNMLIHPRWQNFGRSAIDASDRIARDI